MTNYYYTNMIVLVSKDFNFVFLFREPSLTEKQAYADSKAKLKVAQKLLGQSYCMLVLGLGLEPQHHMYCGQ